VTDDAQTLSGQAAADGSASAAGDASARPSDAVTGASMQERAVSLADERPEVAAGAAFAGGLLLALILKRLAR
jgi:hypothetical protein